jgi:hypothetical protein
MKTKLAISLAVVALVGLLVVPAICGLNGKSAEAQYYLTTEDLVNGIIYPDAMGKINFNCSTGKFVLKGHGLEAGQNFALYVLGENYGSEVAVGSGKAGKGNNVLITGTIENVNEVIGGRWNLWLADEHGNKIANSRVLRSSADDPITCP